MDLECVDFFKWYYKQYKNKNIIENKESYNMIVIPNKTYQKPFYLYLVKILSSR